MSVGWLLPPCEISNRRIAAVDRKSIGGRHGASAPLPILAALLRISRAGNIK
jgi:hypothetical protein